MFYVRLLIVRLCFMTDIVRYYSLIDCILLIYLAV